MADAKRDNNYVTTLLGVSLADLTTPIPVAVDPATNRLLVQATISGSASDGAIVDGANSAIKATVFDYTNSNPIAAIIVDTNGDPASLGGGTQYTEDAPAAANPVGTMGMMIRVDSLISEVSADGDNIAFRGTDRGELYVKHTDPMTVVASSLDIRLLTTSDMITVIGSQNNSLEQLSLGGGTKFPLTTAIVDGSGNQITSFGGGTEYTDGDADATPTGTVMLGFDGANVRAVTVDAAGDLQIDVVTMPTVTVQATNLDIRDLSSATDSVTVTGSVAISGSVAVTGTFFQATQPISAVSLPLPTGAATETTLGTRLSESDFDSKIGSLTETAPASDTASSGLNGRLQRVAQRITSLIAILPASLGQKAMAASLAVVIASDQSTLPVKEVRSSSPSQSSPSVTTTSTSILASNANRLGFTIYNEGSAVCYMKLGATASTTSYTLQIASGGYYECPFNYTGAVDGITSSGTAQLRVTEIT